MLRSDISNFLTRAEQELKGLVCEELSNPKPEACAYEDEDEDEVCEGWLAYKEMHYSS